jgi:hypothetical protein
MVELRVINSVSLLENENWAKSAATVYAFSGNSTARWTQLARH